MFAIYWPVMAFVAALVVIGAVLVLSVSGFCRARMEALPERDLATYLPEDAEAVFDDFVGNQDASLEMGYPPNDPGYQQSSY
jgi:hypothetical protein